MTRLERSHRRTLYGQGTDDDVSHTYSVCARGTESLSDAYTLLDTTRYGRQQDFEDSPPGWPQKPTCG